MADTMPTQDEVQAVIDCDDVQAWHRMLCRVHAALKAQAEPVGEIVPRFHGYTIVQLFNADLPTGAKLYTHPPAQAQDARDTKRYRWLRTQCTDHLCVRLHTAQVAGRSLDNIIDAAMAQEGDRE